MGLQNVGRVIAQKLRAIPGKLGLRAYTVQRVLRQWDGARAGEGNLTETVTQIVVGEGQPPQVRWLTDEELALGGFDKGTVKVGPVTPTTPGGGYETEFLRPFPPPNTLLHYVLTGPEYPRGANFGLARIDTERSIGIDLYLTRIADSHHDVA